MRDETRPTDSHFWPIEIRLSSDRSQLVVNFDDGTSASISAELLRVESPSAEAQGHGVGQKTTPVGKRHVEISRIDPVGNYAIRIAFSDGHDTGLFTWNTLHDYGQRKDSLMADYESRLCDSGQSRG